MYLKNKKKDGFRSLKPLRKLLESISVVVDGPADATGYIKNTEILATNLQFNNPIAILIPFIVNTIQFLGGKK